MLYKRAKIEYIMLAIAIVALIVMLLLVLSRGQRIKHEDIIARCDQFTEARQ